MLAEPNPVMAAAVQQPVPAASTISVAATMTVRIAGEIFTLGGKLDSGNIVVEYHKPFDQAISLGTIESIAAEIGTALHFDGLSAAIQQVHDDVKGLPVVSDIVHFIDSATIRITDLVINTATKTYGVGLALDFTTSNPLPQLFGITLISLGFSVTKVNDKQPATPGTPTNV
jgi:hypothetical protein